MSPARATQDTVLDYTFDWNNAAEVAIERALGEVPVVGSFLSALFDGPAGRQGGRSCRCLLNWPTSI
jgi:hypothetical protein